MPLPASITGRYDTAVINTDGTPNGLYIAATNSGANVTILGWQPFYYLGNIYVLGDGDRDTITGGHVPDKPWMRAWKSSDGGLTWAVADGANDFQMGKMGALPSFVYTGYPAVVQQQLGGTRIYVFYQNAAGTMSANYFDMATNLWGTAVAGGPTVGTWSLQADDVSFAIFAAALSDGSFGVIYNPITQVNISTIPQTMYVRFNAGVWGTPVTVSTLGGPTAIGADALAGAYVVYMDSTTTQNIFLTYVSSVGAVGSSTFIAPGGGSWSSLLIIGSNLYVAYVDAATSLPTVATTAIPTVAFTYATLSITSSTTYMWMGNIPDVNGVNLVVVSSNFSTMDLFYFRNSAWTFVPLQTVIFAGGKFNTTGVSGKLGYTFHSNSNLTYYSEYQLPSSVPAITTTTIPNGQFNTPYSFTILGTNVTTWSVVGGALPPGLSLNPTTGVISGTPTVSGSYTFQIQLYGGGTTVIAPFTVDIITAPSAVSGVPVTPVTSPWTPGSLWSVSATCAKTGQYGLRRVANGILGDSSTTSSQRVLVAAGQNWFIEFFAKGTVGTDGILGYGFTWYDINGAAISTSLVLSGAATLDWSMYSGYIVAPAGAVTAQPIVEAIGNLVGQWCVNALFTVALDEYFELSSIKHYYTDYALKRGQ